MDTIAPPPEPSSRTEEAGSDPERAAGTGSPKSGRRMWPWLVLVGIVIGAVVAAVLLLRGGDRMEPVGQSAPSPSPSPQTLEPVGNLEATVAPFEVELTWSAPPGAAVDAYDVYRDGELIEEVAADTLAFTDDTVLPEQHYEYSIRADAGEVSAEDVVVNVTTPPAPLRVARLVGTYDVKARTTSRSGVGEYPDDYTRGWKFKPRCKEGACGVVWTDLFNKSERIRLERKGANYEGTGSSTAFIECQGVSVRSTVDIRLKVERASVARGQWTATRLSGTLRHSEPAQLGCVASAVELSIRALRVG